MIFLPPRTYTIVHRDDGYEKSKEELCGCGTHDYYYYYRYNIRHAYNGFRLFTIDAPEFNTYEI